jgi:hypothetical protein
VDDGFFVCLLLFGRPRQFRQARKHLTRYSGDGERAAETVRHPHRHRTFHRTDFIKKEKPTELGEEPANPMEFAFIKAMDRSR